MESNTSRLASDILGSVSLFLNQKLLRTVTVPPETVQILELQTWHLDTQTTSTKYSVLRRTYSNGMVLQGSYPEPPMPLRESVHKRS
jgi:hypothetical protein